MQQERCGPMERKAHAGAALLAGLGSLRGPTLEQPVAEGLQPLEGPMPEQFGKNCSLREGSTLEKFMGDCLPWEGARIGAGKSVRRLPPEEEGHTCMPGIYTVYIHRKCVYAHVCAC